MNKQQAQKNATNYIKSAQFAEKRAEEIRASLFTNPIYATDPLFWSQPLESAHHTNEQALGMHKSFLYQMQYATNLEKGAKNARKRATELLSGWNVVSSRKKSLRQIVFKLMDAHNGRITDQMIYAELSEDTEINLAMAEAYKTAWRRIQYLKKLANH